MTSRDIAVASSSDMANRVADFTIDSMQTKAATGQKETSFQNERWPQQWGYFNQVPDVKSTIILKATWNVGKGGRAGKIIDGVFLENLQHKAIIENIRGIGNESFWDILFNMEVTKRIGGDAYAQKIKVNDVLVNLKLMPPESMKVITDEKGMIIRYEQWSKNPQGKAVATFKPEDIFHLSHNRLADQILGISDIDIMEKTILAEEESYSDMKRVVHSQAKPLIIFKLGTDNSSKIDAFIRKMDDARNKGENIYVPNDVDTFDFEVVKADPSSIILEWRNDIRNKFYRTIGLPQIVPGAGGQGTESESKVIYLAFEQIVEKEQTQLERAVAMQLELDIDLYPPATLAQDLHADEAKDAGQQLAFQPSEKGV